MTDAAIGVDPDAISQWLARLELGVRLPLRMQRIGRGRSNLTLLVEDAAGRRWVLRRPPLGALLASAHDVAREHRVLEHLAASDVPAPRPLALCRDPAVADVPLLLIEHVAGVAVDCGAAAEAVDPPLRRAIGLSLASTLASVHAVDLQRSGLSSLASHGNYGRRQLRRWCRQWEGSRTRELPQVLALAKRLERAVPEQREVTLVHGDYHLSNTIVDPSDGAVRAILDWELCTLGDPLADVGTMLAYWSQTDDPPLEDPFAITARQGFPQRHELAAAYARASGRDVTAVAFWQALAYWKIAIIAEGVRRRTLDHPHNGDPFTPTLVERLLELADQTAEQARV